MAGVAEFAPWEALVEGGVAPGCRAVVIVPAKDEAEGLATMLDALAGQVGVSTAEFEVILLLNNCGDGSAGVAGGWALAHPEMRLHVVERELGADEAHVGTARRWLMDTAWRRLEGRGSILSTDADTLVARDWVARSLAALDAGADAVGGVIGLREGELEAMDAGARRAYLRDRRYQALVARLEDRLDPQVGDAWPRHLEHFGASLACTAEVYARAGGLPAIKPLEDVAFVAELRRVGARLRHDPAVKVFTSARLDGRAEVGLSGQLAIWAGMREEHRVLSAEWLAHRFRTLRGLRDVWAGGGAECGGVVAEALGRGLSEAEFLGVIDCDGLIEDSFVGVKECGVGEACRGLVGMLRGGEGAAGGGRTGARATAGAGILA